MIEEDGITITNFRVKDVVEGEKGEEEKVDIEEIDGVKIYRGGIRGLKDLRTQRNLNPDDFTQKEAEPTEGNNNFK